MTEQEIVRRCLEDICRANGFDAGHVMTQRNLEMLSDAIMAKTSVLLSVSTLKRLLHGEFSRTPQQTTLNTISGYLGFESWQQYKDSIAESRTGKNSKEVTVAAPRDTAVDTSPVINWNRIAVSFFIVVIIAFLGFAKRAPGPRYERAAFSATKTTENEIPNTVVFNYDVEHVSADSFFIQQSWDRNRRVKVQKNKHVLTDIYYEPGYHLAKLIANDSVIRTFDVSIPTDKWVYYAKEKLDLGLPAYITVADERKGYLGIDKEDAVRSLVNVAEPRTYILSYFPSVFGGSSDNFIMKCRARVIDVRNNACPYLMYEVYSQHRFMFFRSASRGCANEIVAGFGDLILNGRNMDLSALATDVRQWQDIEFSVRNKRVNIRVNGVDRFSAEYHASPGVLTGLGFISNGLCQVDFVELKSLDGKVFYQDDFEKLQ
jgi:hypothetical protein